MGNLHVILGIGGAAVNFGRAPAALPLKRACKERGPNWNPLEINALIDAKRTMHHDKKEVVDARDLMNLDMGKWLRISTDVMNIGVSPCHKDGAACKSKWN